MTRAAILLIAAFFVACGDDAPLLDAGVPELDAGSGPADARLFVDPEAPQAPLAPTRPLEPADPGLTAWGTCPSGWISETSTRAFGEQLCLPYLRALTCPEGQVHLPGTDACAAIGGPCPPGEYNEQLPPGAIFVGPGENLAAAIAAAPPNAVLALARYEYAEAVELPPGISVIGACAASTRIAGATIAGSTIAVALRDLRVGGELLVDGGRASIDGAWIDALVVRGGEAEVEAEQLIAGRLEVSAGAKVVVRRSALSGGSSIDAASIAELGDSRIEGAIANFGTLELTRSDVSAPIAVLGPAGALTASRLHARAAIALSGGARAIGVRWTIDGAEGVALALADPMTSAELQTLVVKNTRVLAVDRTLGRAIAVENGARLQLRNAVLEANLDFGVLVNHVGSAVNAEDLIVRDTRPNSVERTRGVALTAHNGGWIALARGYLERNSAGVAVGSTGATVELIDVAIAENRGIAGGGLGYGIAVLGGTTTLHRVSIAESAFHGVLAAGADTRVRGTDLAIADTAPQALDALYGRGLGVEGGADVVLERVSIIRSHETGLSAIDPNTRVSLTHATIDDTRPRASDGLAGYGVLAQGGGSILLDRAELAASTKVGVVAMENSPLGLSNVVVRDTRSDPRGEYGIGVVAVSTTIAVSRVRLERNRHTAIRVEGVRARMVGSDLSIRDNSGQEAGARFGAGLLVLGGARASVSRLAVADCPVYAIGVYHQGSLLTASDVVAERTGLSSDGLYASGLVVQDRARAVIERARFVDNAQVGVLAQVGATIELSDVEIRGTRVACASQRPECLDQAGGIGAGSYASSSMTLTRFVLSENAVAGAAIARGGTLDLHRGEVAEHPIGINVETDPFDVARLADDVTFTNNTVNLAAARLPVPDVLAEIPSPLR